MCRALTVVCLATEASSLQALMRAAVATEWELAPGATAGEEALAQIDARRAHVLVAWGPFGEVVDEARRRWPGLRIVAVGSHDAPEADVFVESIEEVRGAILGSPPTGGPVRR